MKEAGASFWPGIAFNRVKDVICFSYLILYIFAVSLAIDYGCPKHTTMNNNKTNFNSLASFWTLDRMCVCVCVRYSLRRANSICNLINIRFRRSSSSNDTQRKKHGFAVPISPSWPQKTHAMAVHVFISIVCCSYCFKYARFTSFYRLVAVEMPILVYTRAPNSHTAKRFMESDEN